MKTVFTFFSCCLIALKTLAQPGTLDKTFNDSGKAISYDFGVVRATAIQSDGKIIVGGEIFTDSLHAFTIVRYLPDGTQDKFFGTEGKVQTAFADGSGGIYNLSVLKNGKILASGYGLIFFQFPIYQSPILAQYLPDGTPDSSFGTNGIVTINTRSIGTVTTNSMEVMSDGRIIQAGSNSKQGTTVIRYMPDGSLDASFGNNGISNVSLYGLDRINATIVQPDNKIIVAGEANIGSNGNFLIGRLLENGNLDSLFGYNGKRTIDYNNNEDVINALALQPDGKILAAGRVDVHGISTPVMILVRFNPDGFYDNSFGNKGIALAKFDNPSSSAYSMSLNDGKITLGGYAGTLLNSDTSAQYFAIAQFNTNGIPNEEFGINGTAATAFPNYYASAHSISLQPDGKIITAGNAFPPNSEAQPYYNLAIARYNNNVQNKTPLARIKKWIEHHILHWQNMQADKTAYYTIERSNNATGIFTQIAKIKSKIGNSKSEIYGYALPSIAINNSSIINYYRINAVNNSGNIIASAIINDTEAEDAAAISVYPNPVKNILHIKGLDANTKYQVRITSEKGNVFASASIDKTVSYDFNVQGLHRGIYYAAIILSSGKPVLIKFIKE